MPGNMMSADISFPQLSNEQSDSEKISLIMNYLYMLLEQFRYTLSNLGEGNFNETELDGLQRKFTAPVSQQVEDLEGNLSEVSQRADAMEMSIRSLDGRYISLKYTVDGIIISDSSGSTYVSGSKVKSGTIEGSVLKCVMDEDDSESDGKLYFYYGDTRVGSLSLDTGGSGTEEESKRRLILRTESPDFVLKLLSAGNTSYEANDSVYLKAAKQMVLSAEEGVRIRARGEVGQYEFRSDGIYYGGNRILSVEQ